jgi:hypothetical protein
VKPSFTVKRGRPRGLLEAASEIDPVLASRHHSHINTA